MAAINVLLLATGICRAFVLFIDPYNTRRVSLCQFVSLLRGNILNSLFSEYFVRRHAFDMGPRLMQLSDSSVIITISLLTIDSSQYCLNFDLAIEIVFSNSFYIVASRTFKYEKEISCGNSYRINCRSPRSCRYSCSNRL